MSRLPLEVQPISQHAASASLREPHPPAMIAGKAIGSPEPRCLSAPRAHPRVGSATERPMPEARGEGTGQCNARCDTDRACDHRAQACAQICSCLLQLHGRLEVELESLNIIIVSSVLRGLMRGLRTGHHRMRKVFAGSDR